MSDVSRWPLKGLRTRFSRHGPAVRRLRAAGLRTFTSARQVIAERARPCSRRSPRRGGGQGRRSGIISALSLSTETKDGHRALFLSQKVQELAQQEWSAGGQAAAVVPVHSILQTELPGFQCLWFTVVGAVAGAAVNGIVETLHGRLFQPHRRIGSQFAQLNQSKTGMQAIDHVFPFQPNSRARFISGIKQLRSLCRLHLDSTLLLTADSQPLVKLTNYYLPVPTKIAPVGTGKTRLG